MHLNKNKSIWGFLLLTFLLSSGACFGQESDSEKKIIARVNGEKLTLKQFEEKVKSLNLFFTTPQEDNEKKKRALDELVIDAIVDQKAVKLDLSGNTEFIKQKDKALFETMLGLMFQKEVIDKIQVEEDEIGEFYEKNKDELYAFPQELRLSHIMLEPHLPKGVIPGRIGYQEELNKALKKAFKKSKKIYKKAKKGKDFAAFAEEFSEDIVTNKKGGDLGFLTSPTRWGVLFDSVAFSLEVGQISPPVRSPRGYHLIKVTEKKEKSYQVLDNELKKKIEDRLRFEKQNQKGQEFVEGIKDRALLTYNQEALSQPDTSLSPDTWLLIIEDQDTIEFEQYSLLIDVYKRNLQKDSLGIEDKKDFLLNWIAAETLVKREGERLGYYDDPTVKGQEKAIMLSEGRRILRKELWETDFDPTEEEIEAYYQAHKQDSIYNSLRKAPLHVYHIVFGDSLVARQVKEEIRRGVDFVEMAKKYYRGEEELKDIAYDLGFISEDEMPEPFYHTAEKLKIGEVSEPVKTHWGYHLIKLVDKKPGITFRELKAGIKNTLRVQKIKEFRAQWEKNLRQGEDIWINHKLLKEYKLGKP